MSDWDDGGVGSRGKRISREFAKTLHDFSLRLIQRAGRYFVEDGYGGTVTFSSAMIVDRFRRDFDQQYVVLHDIFEQKVSWMRQTLMVTFDAAGEWELRLLLDGGSVIVAYGGLDGAWHETMGQNVPAFQVPDLSGLISRVCAQIRLRREYRHHLS